MYPTWMLLWFGPRSALLQNAGKLKFAAPQWVHYEQRISCRRNGGTFLIRKAGGFIMVHGNNPKNKYLQVDWTEGCIAITDDEMDEFMDLVQVEPQ
jgi:RecB family endonuclease NucS